MLGTWINKTSIYLTAVWSRFTCISVTCIAYLFCSYYMTTVPLLLYTCRITFVSHFYYKSEVVRFTTSTIEMKLSQWWNLQTSSINGRFIKKNLFDELRWWTRACCVQFFFVFSASRSTGARLSVVWIPHASLGHEVSLSFACNTVMPANERRTCVNWSSSSASSSARSPRSVKTLRVHDDLSPYCSSCISTQTGQRSLETAILRDHEKFYIHANACWSVVRARVRSAVKRIIPTFATGVR